MDRRAETTIEMGRRHVKEPAQRVHEQLNLIDAPEVVITDTFIARADVQSFYDVFQGTGATHRFSP